MPDSWIGLLYIKEHREAVHQKGFVHLDLEIGQGMEDTPTFSEPILVDRKYRGI